MTDDPARRRVSMADVADLAGVSVRPFRESSNDSPRVDPATRERVEVAMAGSATARTARPGPSAPAARRRSASSSHSRLGRQLAHAAGGGGCRILPRIRAPSSPADRPSHFAGAFDQLRDQGVDGAIVLNEATAVARHAQAPRGLDLVVVDAPPDERFAVGWESDHDGGARGDRHLLALGHPTVWHLAGPEDSYAAAERERGWRGALEGAGLVAPPLVRGDWSAHPAIARGWRSPPARTSRPSSRRTTRWPSACSAPSPRGARCPAMSAWWVSTTWRMPRITCRRSRRSARTSANSANVPSRR